LTPDIVGEVIERMIGIPLDWEQRLELVRDHLVQRGLLAELEAESLISHLHLAMQGLDIRPERPNAIILVVGDEQLEDRGLARTLSERLFGTEDRVVAIDLSQFSHGEDVWRLIGSPPGYVGHSERLPIHAVSQIPWSVLLFSNIPDCHPRVREVITTSLHNGFITDGSGKRVFLSDTLVLLTAQLEASALRGIGFSAHGRATDLDTRARLTDTIGDELVELIDHVVHAHPPGTERLGDWLREELLHDLTRQYRSKGVELRWRPSLVDWLASHRASCKTRRDWERLIESQVLARLIPELRSGQGEPLDRPLVYGVEWTGQAVRAEVER
jgi:ATP-dependent Clp protease ATP-binding subunit ClpA